MRFGPGFKWWICGGRMPKIHKQGRGYLCKRQNLMTGLGQVGKMA